MNTEGENNKTEFPEPYDVLPSDEMREKYDLRIENIPRIKLNPQNIPEKLRPLIPYTEKWGTRDDIVREDVLRSVSREELEELVNAVSEYDDDLFDNWLAGPESQNSTLSKEYVAFTELRDAFEGAKWRLDNWIDPIG